jgi:hypothetical protein
MSPVHKISKRLERIWTFPKIANIMTMQSRMQLHVLVYRIVSLRIASGNYEDSPGSRRKLETETENRIHRLSELENKSELEVAQTLCDLYEERVRTRPTGLTGSNKTNNPHNNHNNHYRVTNNPVTAGGAK